MYADTLRSPQLRHEVPLLIPDPFLYAERDGVRHILIGALEIPRLAELGLFELHTGAEFGRRELVASGVPLAEVREEIVERAVKALGITSAVVPESFPMRMADRLRADGVELVSDRGFFVERLRCKADAEIAGIIRAQRAAEEGMNEVRRLLRRATPGADGLELDGEPLAVQRVKTAIGHVFLDADASAEAFIVSHGEQAAIAHHMGAGQLRPGEPIIVDLWPRDNQSGCYTDMTRTFVVGDVPPEVAEWHRLVQSALTEALSHIHNGIEGRAIFDLVCDVFESAGYATSRTGKSKEPTAGFHHGLGHGVGLQVHEPPGLGRAAAGTLRTGDVIAVEPGLYRAGSGGVRLEDLVLVTDSGAQRFTQYPYDLTA